jgi:hypothetical protein
MQPQIPNPNHPKMHPTQTTSIPLPIPYNPDPNLTPLDQKTLKRRPKFASQKNSLKIKK